MLKKFTIACTFLASTLLSASAQEDPALMGTESLEPQVRFATSHGEFVVQLDGKLAPITVKNFLVYVDAGFYDGMIFHRVISGFMIQGGGFEEGMRQRKNEALGLPMEPIINEGYNGLKNDKYTIAMARTSVPDSATSQFFVNVNDNAQLNYIEDKNPGYAVFGRVISGEDVVDKIAKVETGSEAGHQDVPLETVKILSARRNN
ncbi:MAG: peptidylprolyl isomerase [Betaproteobacteria bacterium]|nr:peptidylprolyl isomerase [Betaproteobacteria bacterium]